MTADAIAPDGSEIYFRVQDAERASLVEVELAPGNTSREVKHRTVEEIWYVLAGSGEVWVEPLTRPVAAGDVVLIPTDIPFQFRSLGPGPLRFLCYTSPPWPGDDEAVGVESGGLGRPTV